VVFWKQHVDWTIVSTKGLCVSSWIYGCLGMTYEVNTFTIGIIPCICLFLLSNKGLSSFSSSFEFSTLLWPLTRFYLGDLLDDAKGFYFFGNLSFNSKVFTWHIQASCVLTSVAFIGIYGFVSKKKCCIKISMTKAKVINFYPFNK
jgi:hypothetical protein